MATLHQVKAASIMMKNCTSAMPMATIGTVTGESRKAVVAGFTGKGWRAMAIARHPFPAKPATTAFLLSPVTVPMVAIGIALVQFFIMIDAAFTWWSVAIGHVVLVIAYPIRTLVASLTL